MTTIALGRYPTMRQTLGYGQQEQPGDYTTERLEHLCKTHTPAVWTLWRRTQPPNYRVAPTSNLGVLIAKVRNAADHLNERIEIGGGGPGGRPWDAVHSLSSLQCQRVDLENQARLACGCCLDGDTAGAIAACEAGLHAIARLGVDNDAEIVLR